MKAIVVGAGIGGLATALFLHRHGIECEVFEQAPSIQELGVGINLMPQAIASLSEVGLGPAVEEAGIAPAELCYRTADGLAVWEEPRGRHAGLPFPQVSIHRGRLQGLLADAVRERIAANAIHVDRRFISCRETGEGVEAVFRSAAGEDIAVQGDVLIGADGIHSAVRRMLYPAEGQPRWSGRLMWRGTASWPAFGDGKGFVVAGGNDARLVLFPIAPGEREGELLTNWVCVYRAAEDGAPLQGRESWQGRADRTRCLEALEPFRLPELDVHALASASRDIWEYAMCDRDALPRWSFGRVTLMGDAAHPMYPFGGNGSAQAILDAKALARCLEAAPDEPAGALAAYEAQRRDPVYNVVMLNRQGGPERVIDVVMSKLTDAERDVDAAVPFEARRAIVHDYSKIAGYSAEHLAQAARP